MSIQDCPHKCPEHIPNNPDCRLCNMLFMLWKPAVGNTGVSCERLRVESASRMRMAESIMSDPGQQAMLIFEHLLTEHNKSQLRRWFGSASVYITEYIARLSVTATKKYHERYPWPNGDRPLDRLIVYYMQWGESLMSAESTAWPVTTAAPAGAKPARRPAMHMRYPVMTATTQSVNVTAAATGTCTERNDGMRLPNFFYDLPIATAGKTAMVRVQ